MYTLRPVHIIRYAFWYIILSMFITYFLIHINQIVVPDNDTLIYYLLVHDALKPVLGIIFVVFSGYAINFITSETLTHRFAINRILFSFNNRIQLWIADLLIILIISCYIVVNRLLDIDVISSKEKLEFILILIVLVLVIKFIGWFTWSMIREELFSLANLLLSFISLPFIIFEQLTNEINNSALSNHAKRILNNVFRVISFAMALVILYYFVVIIKVTTEEYFN